MPRVYFAVWPDSATAETLHHVAGEARKTCGGRLMRRETMHLTLAFLGDIPAERLAEATRVADGIVGAAPFTLTLDQLGYWKHNRILWAGGESPPLTVLANALTDGLRVAGFALDARPFVAHMTLLRDAHCPSPPELPAPLDWPVKEFVLVESLLRPEGARYEIIRRWPIMRAPSDRSGGIQ